MHQCSETPAHPLLSLLTIPPMPCGITQSEIHDLYATHFNNIANILLINTYLYLPNDEVYSIVEIEFYLRDVASDHADPYTHGHVHQLTCGEWYFHRVGKNGYRGGTRKGVDITFGSTERNIYGGILIRSIKNERSGGVIEGPSLVVDQILKACGVNMNGGICKLVETIWSFKNGALKDMENSNNMVYLELKPSINNTTAVDNVGVLPATKKRKLGESGSKKQRNISDGKNPTEKSLSIYNSPRVGLTLTDTQKIAYLFKPYRYFTQPFLLKKGRGQLIAGLIATVRDCQEIAKIAGLTVSTVSSYYSDYAKGKESCNITEFMGKRLNTVMYVRMAGVVDSMK
ncbi:6478_t:CDS:1 [Paraglomus brasilianum]|uniref:6478_t:CDS:1 n=1 Tax=Paraglomus brasilianum TaxID=144538 RepID=A0A9N9AKT6_9GLOM|nr:6478_t:CDS:1 [Paraglomus brasilianum]